MRATKTKKANSETAYPDDGLATRTELMAFLKVSQSTVDKMIREGELKPFVVRFGRSVRVPWKAVKKIAGVI